MSENDKGPHYIPELDPHGDNWKPGDGGVRIWWWCLVASIIALIAAAIAVSLGQTTLGLVLLFLGFVLIIPIMIGGTFF